MHYRAVFISDLHLQTSMPKTAQAFFDFMHVHAIHTKQLYLLGDIFEYWAGDDDIDSPLHQQVIDSIRQVSDAGVSVFWMAGNRDFLVGEAFARLSGVQRLPEIFTTTIAGQNIVLTHGDAQCTDDESYMAFRSRVRQQTWQQQFLAMPLEERKSIIADLRTESRHAQRNKSYAITNVNAQAISGLFETSQADVMIHGHTHRPGIHPVEVHNRKCIRYVLPDWDCDGLPTRGGWIRINDCGVIVPEFLQ